jgi:hypothetical protein
MNVISLPWDGDAPVITELTVVAEGRDQVVLSLGVSELALGYGRGQEVVRVGANGRWLEAYY